MALADAYVETREQAVGGGRALLVRAILVGLVSLGGSALLIRMLATEEWAAFSIAYFLLVFFDQLFGANVLGALVRAPGGPSERLRQSASALMLVLAALLPAAVLLLAVPVASVSDADGLFVCLAGLAVAVAISAVRSVPLALLEGRLEYRRVALVEVLDQLTFYALAVPLVAAGGGIAAVALALALREVPSGVLLLWDRHLRTRPTPHRRELRELGDFAFPTLGTAGALLANGLVPALVLGGGHADVLAFVMTTATIGGYAATVQVIVQRVGFPSLVKLGADRRRFAVSASAVLRASEVATATALVPLAALSPWWLPALFGGEWDRAAVPMVLYSAALVLNTPVGLGAAALNALGRPRATFRMTLAMTVVYAAVAVPLVFVDPLWGVSLAFLVSRVVGAVAAVFLMRRAGVSLHVVQQLPLLIGCLAAMTLAAWFAAEDDVAPALTVMAVWGAAWVAAQRAVLRQLLGWTLSRRW